ncbi:MAG: hypothetical protein H6831_03045 [Planctomycetes bacterium]|nr:hypothetical protein [Planctomycetota bacterium]
MTDHARADRTKSEQLRQRSEEVGRQLASSLHDLLASMPEQNWRPQALADVLGQTVLTTGRLLRGATNPNPLGTLIQLPGPQPLRRCVNAAVRAGGDEKLGERAAKAIDAFGELILMHSGGRAEFASILSTWVPESRREFEMRRRQAMFRAAIELKGAQQEIEVLSAVMALSDARDGIDLTVIQGSLGVQRHRPGVLVEVGALEIDLESVEDAMRLRKRKGTGPFGLGALDKYCVNRPATVQVHKLGKRARFSLADETFGAESTVDYWIAHHHPCGLELLENLEGTGEPYFYSVVSFPIHKLVIDTLVHRELVSEKEPWLMMNWSIGEEAARPAQLERSLDRIETHETVSITGYGSQHLRLPEAPNYVPLMRDLFGHLGYDSREFRHARVMIEYPLFGAQASLVQPVRH